MQIRVKKKIIAQEKFVVKFIKEEIKLKLKIAIKED